MEVMNKIHNADDLKKAIKILESKKDVDELALKNQFHETYQTFKPANILKNTVAEVSSSTQFRHNLLNVALGIGAGYLSKKLVIGKSAGLLKKIAGTALQYGVSNLVAKKGEDNLHPRKKGLLKRIFSRSSNSTS